MDRNVAIDRLKAMEPKLRAAGINALYLFGSTARGDSRPDSDVDVMFEVDPAVRFSLLDQAGLQVDLSHALQRPVDFAERHVLHRLVRKRAERDKVQIF